MFKKRAEEVFYGKKLEITLNNKIIKLSFTLHDELEGKSIIIKSIYSNFEKEIKLSKKSNMYEAVVEYKEFESFLVPLSINQLEAEKLIPINDLDKGSFKIYLSIINSSNKKYDGIESTRMINSLNHENNEQIYSFGLFDKVTCEIERINNKSNEIRILNDKNNQISIGYNCSFENYFIESISSIENVDGVTIIKGNVIVNNKVDEFSIVLSGRKKLHELDVETIITSQNKIGVNKYKIAYVTKFKFDQQNQENIVSDNYNVYLKFKVGNDILYKRQKKLSFFNRKKMKLFTTQGLENIYVFLPFYSYSRNFLSFKVEEFEKNTYEFMQRKIKSRLYDRFINRKRDIWLIAEHVNKAQDNGFIFFKYMRENYPEKEVYYVIEADSPDRDKVAKLGNVLDFKSKKHIELTLLASKFISSHHYDFMLPLTDEKFKKKLKGARIFLQHGVFGTKQLVKLYGDHISTFYTDAFIVSSEKEKRNAVKDLRYPEEMVKVTGLARFDDLFRTAQIENQILIIPTWRNWLQNIDEFLNSEYFERYKNLIKNEKLISYCQTNNIKILFCLHPNMQQYSHLFESEIVKIINQGEVSVQHLIKTSKLMITDYSSVSFDFSFLSKPVIYYMFDRSDFFAGAGSHFDLDEDLPGKIVISEDQLVDKTIDYINNNFVMEDKYIKRADNLIKYRDNNNCDRIMKVIQTTKKNSSLGRRIKKSEFIRLTYSKYRKSSFYRKSIKFIAKILRLLPMKKNTVVIESGLGKMYGDSPKAIYDVLKKNHPEMKKIIVYNNLIPNIDENTKVIERLSFKYVYELSRAKYWINNQNYPYYLKRRKKGVYLQTWHGTPLKKMFHDLDNFYGRDSGYKKRNMQAIAQWSHLISPSNYASDKFKSAFKHNAEILEYGYPRNDILYTGNNKENITTLKNKIEVPDNKTIFLYTPTFRDDNFIKNGVFKYEMELDFDEIAKILGDDKLFLIRLHMIVSEKLVIPEKYRDRIIDVSSYPNVEDLLLISDLLITDYSSVFFDYLNLGKPIIFYAYDLEDYKNKLRGFYINYNEENLPGPLALDEKQLYFLLENNEEITVKYKDKLNNYKDIYCQFDDGHVSDKIVAEIFK